MLNKIDAKKITGLFAGLFLVFAATWGFGEDGKSLSLEEISVLIPKIENAEKNIHNVKVDAESWVEERATLAEHWQRTSVYILCTAWLEGKPAGKMRIDVHKENLKWIDGDSPYFERSYSASYDGIDTKIQENTTGYSGKTFVKNDGQILKGASQLLKSDNMAYCIGSKYTTNFFFSNKDKSLPFSEMFKALINPEVLEKSKVQFDFKYELKDGILCLKFGTAPAIWGSETWWFDPNRGFALIAYLQTKKDKSGNEHFVTDMKINKLKEVGEGIWWPIEATVETELRDPKVNDSNNPYKRTVYRSLNVLVNDPNFNENVFDIKFPKGFRVHDKIKGKVYVVDSNNS